MELLNIKDTAANQKELEIKIEKAAFDAEVDKAFKKNIANINIPGFRKGKAPRSIVEKMYGKGVFYEDALNAILPEVYEKAAEESKLEIVSRPEIDVKSIDDNGVIVLAKVYIKPDVKVSEYKGLKVEREAVEITDEAVATEIDRVRQRNARTIEITDRAAKMGDDVVFDFDGYVDGVAFDGGKAEGHSLELGSGQFIPGFEDQIIGKNVDDEFDVNVTFPEEYGAKELAGKPAVFKVKLYEIKLRELPAADDEFAKDVSEFDTLKELKADLKKKALERKKKAAEEAVENLLVQQIVDGIKGEIPEAMFTNRLNQSVEEFNYRLQSQGMNLDLYLQYTGSTIEQFRETFRPQAEMQVKYRLALEKIVELEGIKADEAAVEAEYAKIAESYNMEADKVKNYIPASEIEKDVAVSKAIDFIKENAVITDAAPEKKESKKASDKTNEE